jgi:ABC-type nitrate/sulfonate/bicarbonate transport system substrate-binding protein/signal transduction histidine kinase
MARRFGIYAALSAFALWGLSVRADAADKLVLQLDAPAQFEFAGYYAALWRGFYRDAGLDIAIRPGAAPGAPPIDPVREVTEGRARFGTGNVQLLIRAAQGLPIVLLAPIFQDSGARIYYRADSDFSSPGALVGAHVGRLPASNMLDIELRSALQSEGIDPGKLHSVPIDPGQAVAALASHDIDAAIGSMWQLPWQARVYGLAVKSFNPAGYRTEFYGEGLFALERFATSEPATVRRFRAASLRGWEYALQHPEEIAARMAAQLPAPPGVADKAGFARYQIEVARQLSGYPAIQLGHTNPERWEQIQQQLIAVEAMTRPTELDDFLYDPDAAARSRTDRHAEIVVAGAVGVVVLLALGLLWGWRRRQPASAGAGYAATRGADTERGLAAVVADIAEELREAVERLAGAVEQIRRHAVLQPRLGPASATALDGLGHLRVLGRRLSLAAARGAPGVRPTDLNALLGSLEAPLRRRLPENVTCRLSLLPEPWLGDVDPDTLAPLIEELVDAAIADMPAGGTLIVGTRHFAIDAATAAQTPGAAVGEYVRITVRDDGGGLDGEGLEQIFDPTASPRPAVAAARELVRRLGGFARVESAEGIGTAVHLYFRHSVGDRDTGPAEGDAPARAAAE